MRVSANKEAARKHLGTAKEFVQAHRDVAAIPRPDGAESAGSSPQSSCSDATDNSQVVGGFAHPIGDSCRMVHLSG